MADHKYTIELNVYSGDELKFSGASAKGAFLSTQENFIKNGAIIPELPEKNEENALTGKSVLFVGDSITEAICEVNIAQTHIAAGWPGRIGMANEMFFINKGLSGASISDCRGTNTVINQMMAMKNYSFDLLIMHGGVNDAWDSAPVGQMTALDNFDGATFDQSTYAGGLEYLFWYAKTYYPDAVKGYIINFRLPGSTIGRLSDMSEYFAVARDICDKWDIPYLDLYANDELNDRMKATTRYALGDYIHPNDRGYDILYPYVEQFCACIMEGGDPSKLTDPERLPEQGSSITASDINVALGKTVTNGAGSTSTVPTDGKVDGYFSAGNWGTAEEGSYGTAGNCYIQIDLGYYYDIDKLNVVTFVGNLLYQWEAYATTDATLSIDKWTKLGAKDGYEMSYEDGYTLSFEKTSARYVRIYGIYDNASTAFFFNEVSVYGTPSTETEEDISKVSGSTATLPDNTTSDKLTDGNTTTDALVVTPKDGGSILYDLGALTELQTIKTYTAGTDSSYGIYGSVDGQTWVLLGTKELNKASEAYDANVGWCNVMSVSGSYRYLRWQWLNSTRADGYVSAAEIEVYAKDSDTALSGITATATNAVYGANNTIDGNYKSYCFLCRKNDGTVIDLGRSVALRYATLYPASCEEKLFFAASADNKNWITIGAAEAGSTDPVTGYLMGEYRYFKIYTEGGAGYSAYELEVYAVTEQTDEPAVDPDEPVDPEDPVDPEEPAVESEELTDKEEVTITLGDGTAAPKLKDDVTDSSYTLIAEGKACYALIDLQKSYTLTKVIVNALNGNYLFEVYGSVDGTEYTKLGANEASTSYVASEGFVVEVSGNYRYVKVVGTGCQYGYFTIYEIDVYGTETATEEEPVVESEELTDKEEVTITLGNGNAAPKLKDDVTDSSYTLIAEGDSCYALVDLQKVYTLTKVIVNTINGNYRFEVYGSLDGVKYTKLGENGAVDSYVAADGFAIAVSGNYRYVKVVGTTCQYGNFTLYELDVYGHEVCLDGYVSKEVTDTTVTAGGVSTDKLTDGNKTSDGVSLKMPVGGQVTVDMGSVTKISKIDAHIVTMNNGAFAIYASADGENWVYLDTKSVSDTRIVDHCLTITVNGSYRYVKVVGLDGARTDVYSCALTELDVFDENGAEVALTVSSHSDVVYQNNIKDGNYGNYVFIKESTETAGDLTVIVDLKEEKLLTKIDVHTAKGNQIFLLEVSSDGENYIVFGQNEASVSYDPSVGFTVEGMATARYIRLTIVDGVDADGSFTLYEVVAYESVQAQEEFSVYDIDKDGSCTITDVTVLLNALSGVQEIDGGDVDADGVRNISDVTALLNYLSTVKEAA